MTIHRLITDKLKIGVLMGGYSSEREISLKSGKAVLRSLNFSGFDAIAVEILSRDPEDIKKEITSSGIELAFIALHGLLGEDGIIQSILDSLHIPYTGSGVEACQLTINKEKTQKLLKKNNIMIPRYDSVSGYDKIDLKNLWDRLDFAPVIVKPVCEGSSFGISIVHHQKDLSEALSLAWNYGDQVLIEEYIVGREMTISILRREALPVVEICPKRTFFDYEAKYEVGLTDYIVPAVIPQEIAKQLKNVGLRVHHLLKCQDLSRVDFILDQNNDFYVLEINTIPGFTETSLLPKAAGSIGINFDQLCITLVELAYGKKKEKTFTGSGC